MPMTKGDLGCKFLIDVCANGSVHIRERGTPMQPGVLPVFSTDTREQAEMLQVRHCRAAQDGSGLYYLNDPPKGVEDLGRVSDLFRATMSSQSVKDFDTHATKVLDDGRGADEEVRVNDLREGRGTHHPRVRVMSIDEDGDAECILIRSGNRKRIRVVTLSKAYKLIQRNYGPGVVA